MAYVITDACIGTTDQSCVGVCPVDCIHEAGAMFVIDPDECIDCGACEPVCPVEAIYPEDMVPDDQAPFIAINSAWVEGGRSAAETALSRHRGELAA